MRRLSLILFLLLFLGLEALFAQTKAITGKVIGSDGDPIPGATVLIKGTQTGVVTDIDGNYSLQVTADATAIQISYLGYQTQEIALGAQSAYDAKLESESINIDEVVVTALGVKREKKALGFATQEVKAAELTRASNNDMVTSLQGKVAGVDIRPSSGMPGASSQMVIRGSRSLSGDNKPLYVVDGMPISSNSDFSVGNGSGGVTGSDISDRSLDIDPNEIESINILRGQAAAALYGIKASNGVIIITTKSGRGLAKGKPVVNINSSLSFQQISRTPELQSTFSQGTNGKYGATSSQSWGQRIETLPDNATVGGNSQGHPGMYYVQQREQAGLDPWVTPQVYDNVGDFFETGHTINTSANVSQNLDRGNYSFGLGSSNQTGIISSTGMERYNGKILAETDLGKGFKTGASVNFVSSNIDKAPSGNDAILATVYNAPRTYDLKGIPSYEPLDKYSQIGYRGFFNNPYWSAENNKFNEKTNRVYGNTFLEYTPKINWSSDKKLSFKYQYGIDSYTTNMQDIFEYGSNFGTGSLRNYGVTNLTRNSLLSANYGMNINDDIELTAILGNEVNDNSQKYYSQDGQDLNFGGWPNIVNANVVTATEEQYQDRTVGFFGSLSLNYKSLLFLNATGRNDYVSTMPTNNRSFFYPSVSLSFVFSELEPLKNNPILSFGKLRFSYAQVGQAGKYKPNYYTKPSYAGGYWNNTPINYPIGGVNAYISSNVLYDKGLVPQNTISYESGIDLKFLKNRLSVEYTFSRQNVTDQIFEVPLAGSSGASLLTMNAGKVHTNAHELLVSGIIVQNRSFIWDLGVTFTKIDNYVDELAPGVESIRLGGYDIPEVRAQVGSKFPILYGATFQRDKQGRILVDEDPSSLSYGMPMAGAPGVIGNCAPNFTMGFNTKFDYKNFTLAAVVSWQNGGQMLSGSNQMLDYYGMSKRTEDRTTPFVYDGYLSNGQHNNIQRGGATDALAYQTLYKDVLGNIDEAGVYDMDFVKLREVSLAYRVPKFYGVDLSVSVYLRNLLLWSKMPNFDPESSQGNGNMGGYFERWSMPQTSSYGLGLNLTF